MRAVHGILRDAAGNELDDPVVVLSPDQNSSTSTFTAARGSFARFSIWQPMQVLKWSSALNCRCRMKQSMRRMRSSGKSPRICLWRQQNWHCERFWRRKMRGGNSSERSSYPATEIDAILNDRSLHWLLHPPRVAIVGAANVGKSTLANRLFAQERSITADIPGTTRDWVGEMANLDGLAVQLVDTPGIRQTEDAIEREAIQRSEPQIRRADLVILVLDASRPLAADQAPLLDRFPDSLRVINKVDATPAWNIRMKSVDSHRRDKRTGHR